MVTQNHKNILALGQFEFDGEIEDSDAIVIQVINSHSTPMGWFKLYDKDGLLKDVQSGQIVDKALSEKRPKLEGEGPKQGPQNTKIRPKKIPRIPESKQPEIIKVAKIVQNKQPKQKVENGKREYKISDEMRRLRSERMKATMRAYWENKKSRL